MFTREVRVLTCIGGIHREKTQSLSVWNVKHDSPIAEWPNPAMESAQTHTHIDTKQFWHWNILHIYGHNARGAQATRSEIIWRLMTLRRSRECDSDHLHALRMRRQCRFLFKKFSSNNSSVTFVRRKSFLSVDKSNKLIKCLAIDFHSIRFRCGPVSFLPTPNKHSHSRRNGRSTVLNATRKQTHAVRISTNFKCINRLTTPYLPRPEIVVQRKVSIILCVCQMKPFKNSIP